MENFITFFDWDNTLFPSTYEESLVKDNYVIDVHIEKNNDVHIDIPNEFNSLENSIKKLVGEAKRYGKVYLLTNGSIEWINYCFTTYLKNLDKNELFDDIISARDLYSNEFRSIKMWKFMSLASFLEKNHVRDILFISDMPYDFESFEAVKMCYESVNFKYIKFSEMMSIQEIVDTHNKLKDNLFMMIFMTDTCLFRLLKSFWYIFSLFRKSYF